MLFNAFGFDDNIRFTEVFDEGTQAPWYSLKLSL